MNINKNFLKEINLLKKSGKTIGLVHGVFDVIHVGHINHFREAKKKVDILIASVTDDKHVNKAPGKPLFNIDQRMGLLKNIKCVDYVIKNQNVTSIENINLIKPNIYFKGKDYKENLDITKNIFKEKKAIEKNGGKIIYTDSQIFSSSKIINENFNYLNPEFKDFIKKNKIINLNKKFYQTFKKKKKEKILVLGDPIIDIYNYVKPTGKSNKTTIISTLHKNKEAFGGGVFLAANTLANFFKDVSIIHFNNDNNNNYYDNFLNKNIRKIKINTDAKLIEKKRYIDEYSNKKLFQVTKNEDTQLEKKTIDQLYNKIKYYKNKVDYIFIFDYGYFSLNEKIIKLINSIGYNKKVINCQTNSFNFGFNNFIKYKKSKIMCVDEVEFRLAMQNKNSPIKDLLKKNNNLIKQYKNFTVTVGKNGCYTNLKNKIFYVPTLFNTSKDTIGCGDIFITIMGMLDICKNFSIIETCIISHLSAGLHADSFGNSSVIKFEKLYKTIDNLIK
jgi:rfaE bifunctional protein nucleotidyltransferase chain/domain